MQISAACVCASLPAASQPVCQPRPLLASPLAYPLTLFQRLNDSWQRSKCSWQKLTKFVAAIFGKNYVKFGFSCQKSFAQEAESTVYYRCI